MDNIYLQKKRNHHNYTEEYVYTYKLPPSSVRLIVISLCKRRIKHLALDLEQKVALKNDVPRQGEHTLQGFLHLDQLLALLAHGPTEADCAAALWVAPVKRQQRLLNIVSADNCHSLISRLPRQVVLTEEFALTELKVPINDVY